MHSRKPSADAPDTCAQSRDGSFLEHRSLLFGIAYRMLGSASDAEDIVQDAYVRWMEANTGDVRSPRSYLATTVTRLCIDQLRSARVQRQTYVGPWLPEVVLTASDPDPAETVTLSESLTLAFLTVLQGLRPIERSVFLLRDVFGFEYTEIATTVGKTEVNCRQIARRARARLAAVPQLDPPSPEQLQLAERFARAASAGDIETVRRLLSTDATLWADGGGAVAAARHPVVGATSVAAFVVNTLQHHPSVLRMQTAWINHQPGILAFDGDELVAAVVIDIIGGRIRTIRNLLNPAKLDWLRRELPGPVLDHNA